MLTKEKLDEIKARWHPESRADTNERVAREDVRVLVDEVERLQHTGGGLIVYLAPGVVG
jgi:hypothetical protein